MEKNLEKTMEKNRYGLVSIYIEMQAVVEYSNPTNVSIPVYD